MNINLSHNRDYILKERWNNVFSSLRCLTVPKQPQPCLFFTTLLWQGELKRDNEIKGKGMKLAWCHVLWGLLGGLLRVFRVCTAAINKALERAFYPPVTDELCLPSLPPCTASTMKGTGPTECRKLSFTLWNLPAQEEPRNFKLSLLATTREVFSCHLLPRTRPCRG